MRVAIIGAGIAGTSAAWLLDRAGFEVHLFEKSESIGGNAKTHCWNVDGETVETGLSVLAWPSFYFHNYEALLRHLDVPTCEVELPFFLNHRGSVYAQHRDCELRDRYATDFRRWRALVETVRRTNNALARNNHRDSLYSQPRLSPFNFIAAKRLVRGAGISESFWRNIFVAIHSSSFLTTALDSVPAVILPALDDLMPLERIPRLTTWSGCSSDVFRRMTHAFSDRVHTGCTLRSVQRTAQEVVLQDSHGRHRFDHVVFACPARTVLELLDRPSPMERRLLSQVGYVEDRDPCFIDGRVHSDTTVIAERHRDEVLERCANYIESYRDESGTLRYENTFVLSSWIPNARHVTRPMLVTYNSRKEIRNAERIVDNRRAHPSLNARSLIVVALLRYLQGKQRTHFCGSYTTPGNGHDLSLLSGLVVATALGATYPFHDDARAKADFESLGGLMLSGRPTSVLEGRDSV